ncbi:hypothetical protein [uncultured Roseobacter sp.]|uniref:hypothetical protein n=1 Tax=uncultured Roseobacter sp. TaxID=114847 RepID=UPI0026248DB2|nr:hypothetical protein [uncultured Roseobacter sp.]
MTVLSNSDALEENATARIRSLCYTCHAHGCMIPDTRLNEIDKEFVAHVVANFDYFAGRINKHVAESCVVLAEEVGQFRFFLAMRWQGRCDDPIEALPMIEAACRERPSSTKMAQELIALLGPTRGSIAETDRVIQQWAEDVYLAELAAFAAFEKAS